MNDFPILLVEDSKHDVRIARRAWRVNRISNQLHVVPHGQACLDFLPHEAKYSDPKQYPRPGIILMDIRMPVFSRFFQACADFGVYESRILAQLRRARLGADDCPRIRPLTRRRRPNFRLRTRMPRADDHSGGLILVCDSFLVAFISTTDLAIPEARRPTIAKVARSVPSYWPHSRPLPSSGNCS